MTMHVDREQLLAAHSIARQRLLAERQHDHWTGELSSSPLSTAAAICALVLAERHVDDAPQDNSALGNSWHSGMLIRSELSELLTKSLRWLAQHQNEDGGWGDADGARSTLAATLMVKAAFHLTGVPAKYADLLLKSDNYLENQGGTTGLKKHFGGDKPFVAGILAVCAMAGLTAWRKVPSMPFELACLPKGCSGYLHQRGLLGSIPLVLSVGLAKNYYSPSRNLLARVFRRQTANSARKVLSQLQEADGSFSFSTLTTSFVIASLASQELNESAEVRKGIEYLLSNIRSDGSWSLGSPMSVTNTAKAVLALDWSFDEQSNGASNLPSPAAEATLNWILAAQVHETQRARGDMAGWPSSPSARALVNTLDTCDCLLSLALWRRKWPRKRTAEVTGAALNGVRWLLALQNRDGGWALAHDWRITAARSSTDAASQAMFCLSVWKKILSKSAAGHPLIQVIERALLLGSAYLEAHQRPEGSWWPSWFGSQWHPEHANATIGTALALRSIHQLEHRHSLMVQRGVRWLTDVQFPSGGWGGGFVPVVRRRPRGKTSPNPLGETEFNNQASVEETSWALQALIPFACKDSSVQKSVDDGLGWLIEVVSTASQSDSTLVAFSPSRVWYHDRLLAPCLAVSALTAACQIREVNPAEMDAVSA